MTQDGAYEATGRTTPTRLRERAAYDRGLVHSILDEALVCHLGWVADGLPVVVPTIHARAGERLYLHGSTGSRPLAAARSGGLDVCVTVTLTDGLVLARSAFHHSMNYRSVMLFGRAEPVDGNEKLAALVAILEHMVAGRSGATRLPTAHELRSTQVIRLPIAEGSAKVRSGGPIEEPADYELPHWAGVVPLTMTRGRPEQDLAGAPGGDVASSSVDQEKRA